MSDTKEIKLESPNRGVLTIRGDLTPPEFGSVIYSLSEERGFSFVLQSVVGMVVDADEFDAEVDRITKLDDEGLESYLKELIGKDLDPGTYSLNVELVSGTKAEVLLDPVEHTVRGMMMLIFGLCTLNNAANLVAEMAGMEEPEDADEH